MIKYMAVAVAVAVSGGVAVPVAVPVAAPVAGLTKRFFHQKDFLISVWGYASCILSSPLNQQVRNVGLCLCRPVKN